MEKSRTVLIGSLISLGILVVIFSAIALKITLEKPVVFHQYMELPLFPQDRGMKGEYFTLDLLQNRTDERKLLFLSFPEAEEVQVHLISPWNSGFWTFQGTEEMGGGVGPYRKTTYEFHMTLESVLEEELALTKVKLHFNDDSVLETDLGKLVLFPVKMDQEDPVGIFSSSSSSDREEIREGRANREFKILGASSSLLDEADEYFQLSLNGVKLEKDMALSIRSGEALSFKAEGLETKGADRYVIFRISPRFHYMDTTMEEKSFRVEMVHERLMNLETFDIIQYLIERGEI
ncbi:hypothetical protein [Proteiniclasticum ruminis]|uniref:Uncharacterized protein n=1 Tax=Proteiniclasticum ruminis TaxID=398199 RepID=A0A1I4XKD0_9CLOT|nr:hypothetical protein [Proteiniclasticum ruminis]SFN26398.1 hypothetical protein SAMN04488695_10145 [Proteiniclasticum ruminis]